MKKFWNWKNRTVSNQETQEQKAERTLFLNGTIAEESWFDDDVTPQLFKEELLADSGDITVWINSPGGDCVAAAQIYNMLMDYKGNITVKIDGIAASAASVIAMAGTKVLVSPVSMMMIHNPATIAFGDTDDMQKAIDMLSEVKESIINAYEIKTGMSRAKLSHLMDAESWMNANKADKIKSFLHFSVPDEGPLTDYESWMPDFMSGLAKGIEKSKGMVASAMDGVAADMVVNPKISTPDTRGILGGMSAGDTIAGITAAITEALAGVGGQNGDIVIPVYIGGTMLDEVVVNAQQRTNLRSGGR